jgi:hypothetical protein
MRDARVGRDRSDRQSSAERARPHEQQPVALLYGPGQRIVHGNPAFVSEFGASVGLPAREVLLDAPPKLFDVVDRVLASGRPLACWLELRGERRRLTAAPRTDIESGEIYGVAIRLAHDA